ncbi:MAG: hypothetical protein ABGX16_20050 [Pirellulales bacterium]
MFRIDMGQTGRYCDGWTRRSFLAGMGWATLADVSRARAASATAGQANKDTSVILLWLDGGPSHLDLYDMNPEAPSEYAASGAQSARTSPASRLANSFRGRPK